MLASFLDDPVLEQDIDLQGVETFNEYFFLPLLGFIQEQDVDDFILNDQDAWPLLCRPWVSLEQLCVAESC